MLKMLNRHIVILCIYTLPEHLIVTIYVTNESTERRFFYSIIL